MLGFKPRQMDPTKLTTIQPALSTATHCTPIIITCAKKYLQKDTADGDNDLSYSGDDA